LAWLQNSVAEQLLQEFVSQGSGTEGEHQNLLRGFLFRQRCMPGRPKCYQTLQNGGLSAVCQGVVEGVEGEGEHRAGFCEVTRKGEPPQRRTFSVTDAKRAKLWGRTGPWSDYPDRMLQLRARGFALRDVFPDVLRNLVTREEAEDYRVVEPVVVRPAFPQAAPKPPAPEGDEWEVFKAQAAPVSEFVEVAAPQEPSGGGASRRVSQAKAAIEKAADLGALDAVRNKITEHLQAGRLDADQAGELAKLCLARADVIIATEEQAAAEDPQEQPAEPAIPF
jgi:hypothetical protein